MTTIQKFEEALTTPDGPLDLLNPSDDVLVMVDEAHRSQYGDLGALMSKALPNATLIGFTGTPIEKGYGRSTTRRFGHLIDSYTIRQSVADGATGLPAVQAVVPAAGRAAGLGGRALPRRRHGGRRRPAQRPRPRGPLPQGPLRHAAHPIRGTHHWRHPPGAGPARFQPPLPSPEHRVSPRRREALRHPGADPRHQATRRAVRSLGSPTERRRTFAATEGELLAGDHTGVVWQQCEGGLGEDPPVEVSPDASLPGILAWVERLMESSYRSLRDDPRPDPDTLYSSEVQVSMPEPARQLASAPATQLTRAGKEALDLLGAWPLCTREHLAGLMGGVTLRRVNKVIRSLRQHELVQEDESLLMLTDRGLTCLARRDRAAVGLTLDRWTAQPAVSNPQVYAGSALRVLASQMRHHAGVTGFAAALTAEAARSPDYNLFDLLPTHRSSIGYRCRGTNYVIHPDASFTLEYMGLWRSFLLEFERRGTRPY